MAVWWVFGRLRRYTARSWVMSAYDGVSQCLLTLMVWLARGLVSWAWACIVFIVYSLLWHDTLTAHDSWINYD